MRGFFAFNALGNCPLTWLPLEKDKERIAAAVERGDKEVEVAVRGVKFTLTFKYDAGSDRPDGPSGKAIGGEMHNHETRRDVRRMYGPSTVLLKANANAADLLRIILSSMEEEEPAEPARLEEPEAKRAK